MNKTAQHVACKPVSMDRSLHGYQTPAAHSHQRSNILLTPVLRPPPSASPGPRHTGSLPLVRPAHVTLVSRPQLVKPRNKTAIVARPPTVRRLTAVVQQDHGLPPLVRAGHMTVATASNGGAGMSVLKPPVAR